MDPSTAYWTWAFANMVLAVGVAVDGVRQIRRGRIPSHARRMRAAAWLVALFVLSYPFKLAWLGREPLETWASSYLWTLRVHELCVAVMLGGGARALYLARRHALASTPSTLPSFGLRTETVQAAALQSHRRAGQIAVAGGILGVATALYVLWGMYSRDATF